MGIRADWAALEPSNFDGNGIAGMGRIDRITPTDAMAAHCRA
jgi:hypothetical protein